VLGAKKQRAVLAMLALDVNRVVSSERLIEGLWGPEAPASAPKMVQLYISQLRMRVRRAVNLATDRTRAVALWRGGRVAEPACQMLPTTLPGSVPSCPYTVAPSPAGTWTGPDLARARALIAASGTRGMRVRVWSDTDKAQFGRYFGRLLARLGYRTSVRILPVGFPYINAVADSRTRAQIGMFGWVADYPSPLTFFEPIFDCAHRIPAARWNLNLSQLCDHRLDRDVARALRVDGIEGGDAWRSAERRLADLAPTVPLDARRRIVFASARAGGVQQHPMWGTLLEQVWVR
jgi:peptide/nickel transport system substrate-binding protein